jgi:hypothetical protein
MPLRSTAICLTVGGDAVHAFAPHALILSVAIPSHQSLAVARMVRWPDSLPELCSHRRIPPLIHHPTLPSADVKDPKLEKEIRIVTVFKKVTKDKFWKSLQTRIAPKLSQVAPSHPLHCSCAGHFSDLPRTVNTLNVRRIAFGYRKTTAR